jgi:hypothetical protein
MVPISLEGRDRAHNLHCSRAPRRCGCCCHRSGNNMPPALLRPGRNDQKTRPACGGFIDLDTGRVVGRDASDNNRIPPGNKRRSPQPQSRLKKVAIASRSCSADPSPHPTGSGTRRRHVTRSPNAGARRCASPYCPGLSGDSLSSSKHAWVDYWICSEVMNIVCQSRFFLENGSMSVKIYAGDCVLYDRQSA